MRRTTAATLLEQVRIFSFLIKNPPKQTLDHHAGEIMRFLIFLHERTVVTHSVRPDIPGPEFPHPSLFLGEEEKGGAPELRLERSASALAALCSDLLNRKLRISPRA